MSHYVFPVVKHNIRVRRRLRALTISLLAGTLLVFGSMPAGQAAAVIGDACPTLFTEYGVPTADSAPHNMASGFNNDVWFSELSEDNEAYGKLGHISADATITEYRVPNTQRGFAINDIVKGADGNMWFSTYGSIGYIDSQNAFTVFNLELNNYVMGMVAHPDGGVWAVIGGPSPGGAIAHISPTGSRTDYPINGLPQTARPGAITMGPDGALWFLYEGSDVTYPDGSTESLGVGVGRMTIAGQTTLYPLSNVPRSLQAITPGPDRALWFTAYRTHQIGRITTSGQVSEYYVGDKTSPYDIKTSPNGELWASKAGTNESLMRINTAPFYVDNFYVPTVSPVLREIAFSGDSVWIAEQQGNKIARLAAPTGPVFAAPTNLTAPSPTSQPALSWNTTQNAASYIVCRDGIQIATSIMPSYTDTANLTAGEHTYAVVAVDAQGNRSGNSAPITLQVDTVQPAIGSITLSKNPLLKGGTTTLRAQGVAGATAVSYSIKGGPRVPMAYDSQTSSWIASFGSSLAVNTYDIEVVATSAAGLDSVPATTTLAVYNPANGYVTGQSQILPGSDDSMPITPDTANKPAQVEFGFNNVKATAGNIPATGSFDIQYKIKNKQNEFSLSDTAVNWLVVPDATHASIQGKATLSVYQNGVLTQHPNVTVRFDMALSNNGGQDTVDINIYDTGAAPTGVGTWVIKGTTTGNSTIQIKP